MYHIPLGSVRKVYPWWAAAVVLAIASPIPVNAGNPAYLFSHWAGSLDGTSGSADGKGAEARFWNPTGMAIDNMGNLFVADAANGTIRKITPDGTVTTLAGKTGQYGSADGTGSAARFSQQVQGLAADAAGNIYVAEWESNTIRMITPSGVVTTVAGTAGQQGSTDGTGSAARFYEPTGVTVDAAGNIYVAEFGNSRIRKILPGGVVTTFAGSVQGYADGTGTAAMFHSPHGLAVDTAGSIYVADSSNCVIRKLTPDGTVTTVAGAPMSFGSADGIWHSARFASPGSLALDETGNLYITDTNNSTIRKITLDRMVATIGGVAGSRGSADGQGANARFDVPVGIAVDRIGNIYVVDASNNSISKGVPIPQASPVFTLQPESQIVTFGGGVTFTAAATDATSYKWVNDTTEGSYFLQDGPSPILTISPVLYLINHDNKFHVTATGPGGSTQSSTFTLTVIDSKTRLVKLTNISTRAYVGTDADVLIAGFIIGGSSSKTVLIRASGPSLAKFGISDALPDPTLSVYRDQTVLATNDNWGDTPTEKEINLQAFKTAGGFPWDDGSKDSAIVMTLNPGLYTAIVSGVGRTTGAALVEVYEVDIANDASSLVNISSRSLVKTGNNIQIAGITISGVGTKKVIIRASGPALTKYGLSGVLSDPKIELHRVNDIIATNDDWDPAIRPDFQRAGIDTWELGSKDAALVVTLNPGGYTAVVSGKNNGTGVALIEVFEAK